MGLYDTADLLRRAKIKLHRPATDAAFTQSTTDDVLYDCATEAQGRINTLLGIYVPDAIWTVPTKLTTPDNGLTYNFGNDTDGDAIFAFGHYTLYPNKECEPTTPLMVGIDYMVQGATIRMPNNAAKVWTDGPYCVYAAPSNVINSTTQPTIPKFARPALLSDLCRRAAEVLQMDPTGFENQFQNDWDEILAAIRTQANGKARPVRPRGPRTPSRWKYGI